MSSRQKDQHHLQEQQGDAEKTLKTLRAIAWTAEDLAFHLVDCWPVHGQGLSAAGPPTQITFANLERYLTDLGRNLVSILAPADHAAHNEWVKTKARVLNPVRREAVSKIKLVCDCLARQFSSDALAHGLMGYWCAIPSVSNETCRPWHPGDGRPIPEIDPQDIIALAWGAAELFDSLGEEALAKTAKSLRLAVLNMAQEEKVHAECLPAAEPTTEKHVMAEGGDRPAPIPANVFARLPGERYRIVFADKDETVPMLEGLRMVELLLKQPGKPAHVMVINRAICEGNPRAAPTADAFTRSDDKQNGMDGFTDDASWAADPWGKEELEKAKEALASLEKRATRAWDEGNDEEANRLDSAVAKYQKLIREQEELSARKRCGQPAQESAVEKVRIKLTNNFRNACKQLRTKYGLPELAAHLKEHIKPGTKWKYRPAPGVEWSFDPGHG
jgi:hypothetical protein